MYKILWPLFVFPALYVTGCAQTVKDTVPKTERKSDVIPEIVSKEVISNEATSKQSNTLPSPTIHDASAMNKTGIVLSDGVKAYWVKAPGKLVYNHTREPIRSLRFQPSVKVYKELDGWGLISLSKDEWVNMSDITDTRPENLLVRPDDKAPKPKISVEDISKNQTK